jgi:glycosyltransferase involved in cell wall biosynthesis
MLGWVEGAAEKILPSFDLFVQSSLWEAMSMVILESFAAGVPVLATTVGENIYTIQDGYNGFLVEPKDVVGMADKIEFLINKPEILKKIGENAQKSFQEKYTAKIMAENHQKLYETFI